MSRLVEVSRSIIEVIREVVTADCEKLYNASQLGTCFVSQ